MDRAWEGAVLDPDWRVLRHGRRETQCGIAPHFR